MLSYAMAIQIVSTIRQWPKLPLYAYAKGLSNTVNLSTDGKDNLLLSSPKTWWQSSSHSWDSHFFHKSDKVGQPSSLIILYAMAIHLVSTSANGK